DDHGLAAQRIVGEHHPAGKHQETEAERAGQDVRYPDWQREALLRFRVLAERCAEIVRHGKASRMGGARRAKTSQHGLHAPGNAAGRRKAAPIGFTARLTSGQFGTVRLASGGTAALLVAPCRRSTAILSALSSFGSGGI